MANELVHGTQGTTLTQAEFESVGLHVCNSQATGDLIYASSATQLTRLAVGAADTILVSDGSNPSWSATPILNTAVAKGIWTASGTWTIPAVTLGGAITGGNNNLNNIAHIGLANTASATTAPIRLSKTYAAPAAAIYLINADLYASGNLSNNNYVGVYHYFESQPSAHTSGIAAGGHFLTLAVPSPNINHTAAKGLIGVRASAYNAKISGTVTGAVAFWADIWGASAAGGTTTNAYGVYISSPKVTGTVTNAYGIYIENITGAGTLNKAIYVAGGLSEFDGKIQADGDIDIASAGVVAGLGTGANGFKLKNLKNAAASALSGTQLDIEVDIGGTPYYFTVYPTKA